MGWRKPSGVTVQVVPARVSSTDCWKVGFGTSPFSGKHLSREQQRLLGFTIRWAGSGNHADREAKDQRSATATASVAWRRGRSGDNRVVVAQLPPRDARVPGECTREELCGASKALGPADGFEPYRPPRDTWCFSRKWRSMFTRWKTRRRSLGRLKATPQPAGSCTGLAIARLSSHRSMWPAIESDL